MINRTETPKKTTRYILCTWRIQRVLMSCVQAVTSTRALSSSSSSSRNTQLHSSNTRLERTRMSRFPNMAYCTAKKTTQDHHSIAQAQRTRDKTGARRGQVVTGTRTLSSSSSSTQRHSSNNRLEEHSYVRVVAVVLLLRTA